jgi:P22_AR N-terminal domain
MLTTREKYRYGRLKVRYFNVEVQAVVVGKVVYFPLRPLCQALGMARQMQIKKLKADSRFKEAFRPLPVPTAKGVRETWCVEKQSVAKWIATIDPDQCPIKAKGLIAQFHDELFAAADRFLFGDTGATIYDPATMTDKPLGGTLFIGSCPKCGAHLCLELDEAGIHLQALAEIDSETDEER